VPWQSQPLYGQSVIGRRPLPVIPADAGETERHEARLRALDKAAGGECLWRRLEGGA